MRRPIFATWARHEGDRYFHAIEQVTRTGSVVTFCNGRWLVQDPVESSDSPPHEERCEQCSRMMIDVRRIEAGLREIRDAEIEVPLPRHWLAVVP